MAGQTQQEVYLAAILKQLIEMNILLTQIQANTA